jgi:hypothetical protein
MAGSVGGGRRIMLPLFNDECLRQRRRTGPIDALPRAAKEQGLHHSRRRTGRYLLCGQRRIRGAKRDQVKCQSSSYDGPSHSRHRHYAKGASAKFQLV